jgi:mRNA-degrading endonuclease RelE of RelBE toxin-antitoxin system
MTKVVLTEHAADKLRRMPAGDRHALMQILHKLEDPNVSKLVGGQATSAKDLYSLPAGNFRVLYTIDNRDAPQKVYVVTIVAKDAPEGSDAELNEVMATTSVGLVTTLR